MARRIALISAVLALAALSPALSGEEPDVSELRRRVMDGEVLVSELRTRLETQFLAIRTDFELLRSPRWRRVARPLLAAIEKRIDSLRAEPESAGKSLGDDFTGAKLLTGISARRLAAAVATRAASLARGESMTPEDLLEQAAAKVFPKKSFEDCWDEKFTDLSLVAKYREANEFLQRQKKDLAAAVAASGKKPDTPPGMVLVPEGRYTWGPWTGWLFELKKNKAEKTRIPAFYIDVHEVTNATWFEFLKATKKKLRKAYLAVGFTLDADGEPVKPKGKDREPARGMWWPAANACATFLGKRLPSEEEWEVAARGAKGPKFPWGDEFGDGVANTKEAGHGGPLPVGTMRGDVSGFGVLDMGGNVSEMTRTLMDRRPARGKLGTEHSFIYRGGNFGDGEESALISYRWTIRAVGEGDARVGFRCVIPVREWKKR